MQIVRRITIERQVVEKTCFGPMPERTKRLASSASDLTAKCRYPWTGAVQTTAAITPRYARNRQEVKKLYTNAGFADRDRCLEAVLSL